MDRHIGGLEQKEMPVTGKVLMASSILPGDRLSEVTVLSDDADHRAARHPSPSRGVALQVTENRGEIVAHASLPGNRLPGRRRRVYPKGTIPARLPRGESDAAIHGRETFARNYAGTAYRGGGPRQIGDRR